MLGSASRLSRLQRTYIPHALHLIHCNGIADPLSTVADYLAQSAPADRSILIDAFSGAGGNTIAFARSQRWDRIMVIEKDPAVMECAKNNARIYGVEEKISWVVGDVYEVLENIPDDIRNSCVVFASPPWGGMPQQNALESARAAGRDMANAQP